MTVSSDTGPRALTARRRWTPVTYDDMRHDHDAAWDAKWSANTTRWPLGWFEWQLTRIVNDATTIRETPLTKGTTR